MRALSRHTSQIRHLGGRKHRYRNGRRGTRSPSFPGPAPVPGSSRRCDGGSHGIGVASRSLRPVGQAGLHVIRDEECRYPRAHRFGPFRSGLPPAPGPKGARTGGDRRPARRVRGRTERMVMNIAGQTRAHPDMAPEAMSGPGQDCVSIRPCARSAKDRVLRHWPHSW